jgi:hypothetical protein
VQLSNTLRHERRQRDLLQQFQPLPAQTVFVLHEASDVAAQLGQAVDDAGMRAYEPPSQPTEMWAGGCEIDFVVNLELLARSVFGHLSQAQPAIPRITHPRFEFHLDLVAVEIEPHFAGETSEGANPSP